MCEPLDHLRGDAETVDEPEKVAVAFEEMQPDPVVFECLALLFRREIDQPTPPGSVGEGVPFRGDRGRVAAILSRTCKTGMIVDRESDIRLEGETCAFQMTFGVSLTTSFLSGWINEFYRKVETHVNCFTFHKSPQLTRDWVKSKYDTRKTASNPPD